MSALTGYRKASTMSAPREKLPRSSPLTKRDSPGRQRPWKAAGDESRRRTTVLPEAIPRYSAVTSSGNLPAVVWTSVLCLLRPGRGAPRRGGRQGSESRRDSRSVFDHPRVRTGDRRPGSFPRSEGSGAERRTPQREFGRPEAVTREHRSGRRSSSTAARKSAGVDSSRDPDAQRAAVGQAVRVPAGHRAQLVEATSRGSRGQPLDLAEVPEHQVAALVERSPRAAGARPGGRRSAGRSRGSSWWRGRSSRRRSRSLRTSRRRPRPSRCRRCRRPGSRAPP